MANFVKQIVTNHGLITAVTVGPITEADQSLSDVTTLDVSITQHGYAPKAPNDATKFLNGVGGYTVPPGTTAVGGADTQVQFNDGGTTLNGDANFTWNKTNKTLTLKAGGSQDCQQWLDSSAVQWVRISKKGWPFFQLTNNLEASADLNASDLGFSVQWV